MVMQACVAVLCISAPPLFPTVATGAGMNLREAHGPRLSTYSLDSGLRGGVVQSSASSVMITSDQTVSVLFIYGYRASDDWKWKLNQLED